MRPGKHSIHRTAGYVIRTSGGVGGRGREASSYPDWAFSWLAAKLGAWHLLFSVKGHFAFSFFHAKNREYTFMLHSSGRAKACRWIHPCVPGMAHSYPDAILWPGFRRAEGKEKGKGVVARRGLEEAQSEIAGR